MNCKTCGQKLAVRKTKDGPSRQQKQYFYTAYYYCPACRKMYLSDEFKVENITRKTSPLFETKLPVRFNVEIWTDGASRHNGTPRARAAWAFVSGKHEEAGLVPGVKQTNNVAEALAVYQALVWASGKGYKKIRLHTDSQVTLFNVVKPLDKIAINREIFSDIRQVIRENNLDVQFVKVLGHSGDKNNSRADRLANTLAGTSE